MIPKVIHYLWFGNGKIPENDLRCMESWKKYCPDYEIKKWDESNYDVTKNQYMREAYEAKKWGFVVDYARLDIIYHHGGIYMDTDVEILKPLDELLLNHAYMGFELDSRIANGQGFGAEKGNEIIKYLMQSNYGDRHFINDDGSYNLDTSTVYNTESFKKMNVKFDNTLQSVGSNMTLYPSEYFCPLNPETGKIKMTDNTYSIHYFDGSWASERDIYTKNVRFKVGKILPDKLESIAVDCLVTLKFDGIGSLAKKTLKKMGLKASK